MGNTTWQDDPAVWDDTHGQWGPLRSGRSDDATVRIDVLSPQRQPVGVLQADVGAQVEWDPQARIPRTLSGLTVVGGLDDIDWHRDLLRPVWVDAEGETPLGLFTWAHAEVRRQPNRTDRLQGGVGYDLTAWLDMPLVETFHLDPGLDSLKPSAALVGKRTYPATVKEALDELLQMAGYDRRRVWLPSYDIIPRRQLGWAAGTPIRRAVRDLCFAAGWVWWADRYGDLNVGRLPTPELDPADVTYRTGDSVWGVLADSAADIRELERRPNVWKVIGTAPTGGPVFAQWELPRQAPGSFVRTGRKIGRVTRAEGLRDTDEAMDVLIEQVRDDYSVEDKITFETRPNPSHDVFTIVGWFGGERFLEEWWQMDLSPTGIQRHRMRRVKLLLDEGLLPDG